MLSLFKVHFGHSGGKRAIGHRAEARQVLWEQAQRNGFQTHRVTLRTSRFVGFAVAFVAGTLASSSTASAQVMHGRVSSAEAESESSPGIFSAVLRSAVSGNVRDRAGRPQVGALVELLNAQYSVVAQTFTDDRGRYTLAHIGAGLYQVKASSSLFLPAVRPNLRVLASSKAVVNLTLSSLYQALDWLPAEPRDASSAQDDWSWTLRLPTNRPLLRMLDAGAAARQPGTNARGEAAQAESSRRTAVHTGFARFGEGGIAQRFLWSTGTGEAQAVLLEGETASEPGSLGRLSTSAEYRRQLSPDRSMTTVATFADRPAIRGGTGSGAQDGLLTMRVRSASTLRLGDLAQVSAGTELEAARFGTTAPVLGSHPFAAVAVHAGSTFVEYRVASAPTMTEAAALESEAAEDTPALVRQGGQLRLEEGLHQELRISRKVRSWAGDVTGELAVFHDTLPHPVVEGAVSGDEAAVDSGDVLYDPGTGTIAVSGQGYSHGGVMALLRDQLSPDTWLSLRYAMGDAIFLGQPAAETARGLPAFAAQAASMVSIAGGMRVPASNTLIRGSYRWQPAGTLTSVTPFDDSTPDAYLGVSVRQPLRFEHVGTGKLEAILDVRNLLAQGYRPFLSQDGTTVYFAQAQRCITGGISFSF